jgi:HK97 family phage portal protein
LKKYGTTLRKRLPGNAGEARTRPGQAMQNTGFTIGSPVTSGILVTPATAMNFVSVFSAVNGIATDLACLDLGTQRRGVGDAREPAPEIAANQLYANSPDEEGESNAFRVRQALMGHVLLWGNGYQEIVRNGRGQPIGLYPLNPARTQPMRDDWTGKLYYKLLDKDQKLLAENVLHLAGLGYDGIAGYSVIHMCRQAVGLGIAAEEFGASFFGNGLTPHGVLKIPKRLTPTARQNLREQYYGVHQGAKNAHHLMILEEGSSWEASGMPLEDAQFLQTRQFSVLEVARMYRYPPNKLMDYSESHLSNVEEQNRDYEQTCLMGWAKAFEAEADNKLLFQSERDRGIFWHHNFGALRRANTQVRTAYYQVMRNMGVMSASQISVSEGMNPIPKADGGDLLLVQAQYQPLATAGQAGFDPKANPAPPAAEEKPPEEKPPAKKDKGSK